MTLRYKLSVVMVRVVSLLLFSLVSNVYAFRWKVEVEKFREPKKYIFLKSGEALRIELGHSKRYCMVNPTHRYEDEREYRQITCTLFKETFYTNFICSRNTVPDKTNIFVAGDERFPGVSMELHCLPGEDRDQFRGIPQEGGLSMMPKTPHPIKTEKDLLPWFEVP